jgi:hypothetical protein
MQALVSPCQDVEQVTTEDEVASPGHQVHRREEQCCVRYHGMNIHVTDVKNDEGWVNAALVALSHKALGASVQMIDASPFRIRILQNTVNAERSHQEQFQVIRFQVSYRVLMEELYSRFALVNYSSSPSCGTLLMRPD